MARPRYRCIECGYRAAKPLGRCPGCGAWGSFAEEQAEKTPAKSAHRAKAIRLGEVSGQEERRIPSGFVEVDRVLGGGFVAGESLILGGEPGVGKSTLLLQLADRLMASGLEVLYVAGEESPAQIRLRAARLGVSDRLLLVRETELDALLALIDELRPGLVFVDSIQSIEAGGVPGSLVSVRTATQALTQAAKRTGAVAVLVGHVTKEGTVAGPKTIEHVVDATFYLETAGLFRVLRGQKNRFGPVGEVGVFRMEDRGLVEVTNPSEAFLSERPVGVPGSVVGLAVTGERPLALEVQALAAKSPYAAPKRVVQGLDQRRVDVALAVVERRLGLRLGHLDVYVNLAGGIRVVDPGLDLAVILAVYSAVVGRPVPEDLAVVGEVGLAGELRSVVGLERRLAEAERAGFSRVLSPLGLRGVEDAVRQAFDAG